MTGIPALESVKVFDVRGITSLAYSLDGQFIATGSNDTSVCLWDVATGHKVRNVAQHAGMVTSVAFSPNGRYLVSGSWSKTVKVQPFTVPGGNGGTGSYARRARARSWQAAHPC